MSWSTPRSRTGKPLAHPATKVGVPVNDWIGRLRGKVTPTESGCWVVGPDPNEYAQCFLGGRTVKAHRAVYELMVGPIEPGNQVYHECETPACINPAHLVQLSPAEHRARHARVA